MREAPTAHPQPFRREDHANRGGARERVLENQMHRFTLRHYPDAVQWIAAVTAVL